MEVLKVNYTSPEAASTFCHSLRTTGFGVLTHHPIPMALVNRVYTGWGDFFNSDLKSEYTYDPKDQSGYFPFRSENAKGYSIKDLKEFFHVYPRAKLPENLRTDTWDLYDRLVALGTEMLGWIQEATPTDIKRNFSMPLSDMIAESEENLLRIIHYPPLKGSEEVGAIRAAAHEDINLITLLCSATSAGLEVKDTAGNWHQVPCDPGSIAINAGDMLQMASDGYYRSTTHRVMNPVGVESKTPRYSMPLFLHPRHEVILKDQITAGSYLTERLREIGLMARTPPVK